MAIQITCITKPSGVLLNPLEAISHYGWYEDSSGKSAIWTRQQMVSWLLSNSSNQAYVKDKFGDKAYCKVYKNSRGTFFLKTQPDGTKADNLLSLPPC